MLQRTIANIHEALDEDEQFRPNAGYDSTVVRNSYTVDFVGAAQRTNIIKR